ncbi:hypothetical protein LIER_05179 [Lithospermum erythrorhizon]|uniref:Uncharacterized protein n=1 Tax=Lithospermum erythrorhizon TaxID=34254 RepID=A0AAV3P0G3_LITER
MGPFGRPLQAPNSPVISARTAAAEAFWYEKNSTKSTLDLEFATSKSRLDLPCSTIILISIAAVPKSSSELGRSIKIIENKLNLRVADYHIIMMDYEC